MYMEIESDDINRGRMGTKLSCFKDNPDIAPKVDDIYWIETSENIYQESEVRANALVLEKIKEAARGLPARQLNFANLILSGYSNATAWQVAYSRKTTRKKANACNLLNENPRIREYIELVKERDSIAGVLSRDEKRKILREIVHSDKATPIEKITAIRVDNKMTGDDVKVTINTHVKFDEIYERLKPDLGLPKKEEYIELEVSAEDSDNKDEGGG